jgi:hypothetical protein
MSAGIVTSNVLGPRGTAVIRESANHSRGAVAAAAVTAAAVPAAAVPAADGDAAVEDDAVEDDAAEDAAGLTCRLSNGGPSSVVPSMVTVTLVPACPPAG